MNEPKVLIHSLFRNRAAHVEKFLVQLALLDWPSKRLELLCNEGDSTDETPALLDRLAPECHFPATVFHRSFGGPLFGSVWDPFRLRLLAEVSNWGIEQAMKRDFDYLLFCESDLLLPTNLLRRLVSIERDVVAPQILSRGSGGFYDTKCFVNLQGQEFQGQRLPENGEPFEVQSVGSCVLVRRAVLEIREALDGGVRMTPQESIRGFCGEARARGFHVYTDPTLLVWHP